MRPLGKLIATIRKNNVEEVRVRLIEHKGYSLVDVRVFAHHRSLQGDRHHTTSGFCVPTDRLDALIAALTDAKHASEIGASAPRPDDFGTAERRKRYGIKPDYPFTRGNIEPGS